jgi:hypothetical protein
MTTIDQIKQELRDIIELSDKATPAPWEHEPQQDSIWSGHDFDLQVAHTMSNPGAGMMWDDDQRRKNATLIAASRNLTPKMAKALLGVIDNLEFAVNKLESDLAKDDLETIRREWEVQA